MTSVNSDITEDPAHRQLVLDFLDFQPGLRSAAFASNSQHLLSSTPGCLLLQCLQIGASWKRFLRSALRSAYVFPVSVEAAAGDVAGWLIFFWSSAMVSFISFNASTTFVARFA